MLPRLVESFTGSARAAGIELLAVTAALAAALAWALARRRPLAARAGVAGFALVATARFAPWFSLPEPPGGLFAFSLVLDTAGLALVVASVSLKRPMTARVAWETGAARPADPAPRDPALAVADAAPEERLPEAPAACDEERALLDRMVSVDDAIAADAPAREIFDAIVEGIVRDAGAELVILRVAKAGDAVYDVRAHAGLGGGPTPPATFSVARERLAAVCRSDRLSDAGYLVDEELARTACDGLVPAGADWRERVGVVRRIEENGRTLAFLTVGFYGGAPPPRAASVIRLSAGSVLRVLQRDRVVEELREKDRALARSREELDSVNQLKANFLSIVSHELRTPLTSIKAYTETLVENVQTIKRETVHDFLRVMHEENERLIKLVDSILNFSRMESGNLKVEKTSCNLNEMIAAAHAAVQPKFLAGNVNAEIRLPKHSCVIDADRELLMQLLQNLMSNAAKFTPPGGRVTVTLEEEASAARIVVQDTGPGVPEDQLEKIFERFHQVDTSSTREHGGSGLGLAICKSIVDWHDGKIWVENVKGAGAKFVVMLPMKDIVVRQAISAGFIGSRRFERERYLTLLVEMLAEFLQARKASIMYIDRQQKVLRILAAKGLDAEFVQNTRLEIGERIAGRVAQTGECLHVFDIESDDCCSRSNNSIFYGTRSFVSVPMRDGKDIVGVLNVADHVEGREFTRADRELLEALGGIIVGMMKKLDAYEKVSANFEKLKDTMRAVLDMREAWGSKNLATFTLIALGVGRRLALDEPSLTALRLGMNIYDLGLMKIPRTIRVKKEELTPKEREKLRDHTNVGYLLSSPMGLEERIMRMIRSHHEHWDGSGYPDRLVGDEIPVEARIVGVVDAFRALLSEGPYRRPYSLAEARAEIGAGANTIFDARVVEAFEAALGDLGARDIGGELILEGVEHELERERGERKKRKEQQQETAAVKEGVA